MSSDDETTKRREMIAQGLLRKKKCEAKASEIVETLVEKDNDRNTIKILLNSITRSHYEDIVVERAIEKKCGYVICPNPLKPPKPQKYHINTKSNVVMDLTERKNFCCEKCFLHSNYLQEQILTSPLWLREEKDKKIYVFQDEEKPPDQTAPDSSIKVNNSDEKEKPEISIKPKKKSIIQHPKKTSKPETSSEIVFKTFKEWWTKDSSAYINGSNLKTDKINESQTSTLSQHDISLYESESMKKVQAFYKGTTDIDMSSLSDEVKEVEIDERRVPTLPQIDKTAQKSMRRDIVLQSFQKGFDKISDYVDVSWNDIAKPTSDLISTFNLTADNIVLHPSAWIIAIGVLMQCLAKKSNTIQKSLEQPFMKQMSTKMSYGGKHLSIFVDELLNVA